MERLLVVDGSNLLFQMFFGMPARIVNEQGKAIQGTLELVYKDSGITTKEVLKGIGL